MRIIKRPETIALLLGGKPAYTKPGEPLTLSFAEFVGFLTDSDQKFNSSGQGIRAAMRIETAVAGDGDVVLDEADWTLLAAVCEAPSNGLPTLSTGTVDIAIGRQLLAFLDAVASAAQGEKPSLRRTLKKHGS